MKLPTTDRVGEVSGASEDRDGAYSVTLSRAILMFLTSKVGE